MQTSPMLSPLFGLPLAAVCLVLLAGHVLALARSEEPTSRKRIRQANSVIGMLTVAAIAEGLCVFSPGGEPRLWALSWISVLMLVCLNVLMAMIDAVNSARLRQRDLRALRDASRALRGELLQARVAWDREAARGSAG